MECLFTANKTTKSLTSNAIINLRVSPCFNWRAEMGTRRYWARGRIGWNWYQTAQLLSINTVRESQVFLHRDVFPVLFPVSWCCWQCCCSGRSHLAGALSSCSIVLCQLPLSVPETPELLCPANFPQGELKIFYFKSSQFLPCIIIFSFSSGFPASQPPRSHKASTNQLGSWVYFKHKNVRLFF